MAIDWSNKTLLGKLGKLSGISAATAKPFVDATRGVADAATVIGNDMALGVGGYGAGAIDYVADAVRTGFNPTKTLGDRIGARNEQIMAADERLGPVASTVSHAAAALTPGSQSALAAKLIGKAVRPAAGLIKNVPGLKNLAQAADDVPTLDTLRASLARKAQGGLDPISTSPVLKAIGSFVSRNGQGLNAMALSPVLGGVVGAGTGGENAPAPAPVAEAAIATANGLTQDQAAGTPTKKARKAMSPMEMFLREFDSGKAGLVSANDDVNVARNLAAMVKTPQDFLAISDYLTTGGKKRATSVDDMLKETLASEIDQVFEAEVQGGAPVAEARARRRQRLLGLLAPSNAMLLGGDEAMQ